MKKALREISFGSKKGYPTGPHLFYKCRVCHEVLPSSPQDNVACQCGNIHIYGYDSRMGVKDNRHIQLLEETGHPILHMLYAVMDYLEPPISHLNNLYLKLTRPPRFRR